MIVGARNSKKGREYLIQWMDPDPDEDPDNPEPWQTWENYNSIVSGEAVSAYLESNIEEQDGIDEDGEVELEQGDLVYHDALHRSAHAIHLRRLSLSLSFSL